MPSCLLGYFAVMLRQAAFAALVVYREQIHSEVARGG